MKPQTSSKGFAVLSFASVISKVLAFIYLPVQSMLVHDNGNGVISAGFKLYILIYALTNAGLPLIISKFISAQLELGDYRGAHVIFRSAFTITMVLGTISTLFTFLASGALAAWCGMSEAKLMFMCIAPTFLFTSISCAMHGYFQGHHTMTPTALAQVVEQLFNSILTVLFEVLLFHYAVRINRDPISFTAAGSAIATVLAVAASAMFLSILFFLHRSRQRELEAHQTYHGPTVRSRNIYGQILRFMFPAIVTAIASGAFDIIDTRSCIPMLVAGGHTALQAYSLFGIYSTKYQRLLTLPILFATPLITAMIPSLSAALSRKDVDSFTHKVREAFRLNFIVVLPLTAAISFLSSPIITLIFLSQNSGSVLVSIGIWAAVFSTIQIIQTGVLISLNQPRIPPLSMIIGMIAKIASNYLLIPIPSINIYGALIGNVLAWSISILLNHYFIQKSLAVNIHVSHDLMKPCTAAMIMGILSFVFYTTANLVMKKLSFQYLIANDIALILTIPVGGIIYFFLSVRMGTITKSDIIKMPLNRLILSVSKKIPFFSWNDS